MKAIFEMELPEDCHECRLCYGGFGEWHYCALMCINTSSEADVERYTNSRAPFCPLKIIKNSKKTLEPKLPESCYHCKLSINICGSKLCVLSDTNVSEYKNTRLSTCPLEILNMNFKNVDKMPDKYQQLLAEKFLRKA